MQKWEYLEAEKRYHDDGYWVESENGKEMTEDQGFWKGTKRVDWFQYLNKNLGDNECELVSSYGINCVFKRSKDL